MIELRWLYVLSVHGRGLTGGTDAQMHEMVLQYRYDKSVENGSLGIMAIFTVPNWSEWKDVPVCTDKVQP